MPRVGPFLAGGLGHDDLQGVDAPGEKTVDGEGGGDAVPEVLGELLGGGVDDGKHGTVALGGWVGGLSGGEVRRYE